MRLQLIVSEAQAIREPLEELRVKYEESEQIKVVKTEQDIDALYEIVSSGLDDFKLKLLDQLNLTNVESKMRLAKTYMDPNSIFYNFI